MNTNVSPTLTRPPNSSPAPQPKTDEFVNASEMAPFSQSLLKATNRDGRNKTGQSSEEKYNEDDKDEDDTAKLKPPLDIGQMGIVAPLIPNLNRDVTNEGTKPTIESVTVDSQGGKSEPTSGAVNTPTSSSSNSKQAQSAQAATDTILNLPNQNAGKTDSTKEAKGFTLSNLFEPVTGETWNAPTGRAQTAHTQSPHDGDKAFSSLKEATFQAFNTSGLDRLSLSLSIDTPAQTDNGTPKVSTHSVNTVALVFVMANSQSAGDTAGEQSDKKKEDTEVAVNIRASKAEPSLNEKFTLTTQTANTAKETSATTQSVRLNIIERMQVIEQVSQKLETMRLQSGNGEINLHLRPEHLGEIQIRLTSGSEGVNARIIAESHPVQQALVEAKEHLQRSLESRGVVLNSYEVSLMQSAFSGRQSPQRQGYEAGQNRFQPRATGSSFRIEGIQPDKPTVAIVPRAPIRDPRALLDYSA